MRINNVEIQTNIVKLANKLEVSCKIKLGITNACKWIAGC